jgi:hypothetical protein
VRLTWFDGESPLFKDRPIPLPPAGTFPDLTLTTVFIEASVTGSRWAVVRGLIDDLVVAAGAAQVTLVQGRRGTATVELLAGDLADRDGDGIPDVVQGCDAHAAGVCSLDAGPEGPIGATGADTGPAADDVAALPVPTVDAAVDAVPAGRDTAPPPIVDAASPGPRDAAPEVAADLRADTRDVAPGPGSDGSVDGAAAPCKWSRFSMLTNLAEINSPGSEWGPFPSGDALTLTWTADPPGSAGHDLYFSTRATTTAKFSARMPVSELNTAADEFSPFISSDGLEVFFDRSDATGSRIMRAQRTQAGMPWGTPVVVTGLMGPVNKQSGAFLRTDNVTLYHCFEVPGRGYELAVAIRPDRNGTFVPERVVDELNSTGSDCYATVSGDGLEIFFETSRAGRSQIFTSRRATRMERWQPPTLVTELDLGGTTGSGDPRLSSDGTTLYFSADHPGGAGNFDLWYARRTCAP